MNIAFCFTVQCGRKFTKQGILDNVKNTYFNVITCIVPLCNCLYFFTLYLIIATNSYVQNNAAVSKGGNHR